MDQDPLPPRAERPDWRKPRLLVVGAGALLFCLGLVDPLVPEIGDLPELVRAAFVLVPILIALVWAAPNARQEAGIAVERYRWYGRVFARMESERAQAEEMAVYADRERVRSASLSILFTAAAVHQGRFQVRRFSISMPRLEDETLVVAIRAIDPADTAVPSSGERLVVVDPEDGKWQGVIEVLAHRSLSGERLARIADSDTLWLSFLLQKAASREAYRANAVAIYVTDVEGASRG